MITALLSWFDEKPEALTDCISSLPLVGVSRLVAVDGAYRNFSDRATSPPEQAEAIQAAASAAGIECLTHVPTAGAWPTEVRKRSFLFELGQPSDWFFVVDADEVVESANRVPERLAATELDAAAVTLDEGGDPAPLRMFFRAIPGLKVERNHHTYVTPDGRRLWGGHGMEPALDLTDVVVSHERDRRTPERNDQADAYYTWRNASGIEMGSCELGCGRVATTELPTGWHLKQDGLLSSHWIAVCDDHVSQVRIENQRKLESFGLNPALVRVTYRRPDEVLA